MLMKRIFDPYVLWPFDKKLIVTQVRTCNYTVVYVYYELYLCLKIPLSLSFKSWNWKSHTFAIGISQLTILIWTVPFQNLMENPELISYFLHFVRDIIYKPIYFKPIDNLGPINNDKALPSPVKKWRKREKVWIGLEEFIGFHK